MRRCSSTLIRREAKSLHEPGTKISTARILLWDIKPRTLSRPTLPQQAISCARPTAPQIAYCYNRATWRKIRRGSNRRCMKNQWQVISRASTRRAKSSRLGVETIMSFVLTALSAKNAERASFAGSQPRPPRRRIGLPHEK